MLQISILLPHFCFATILGLGNPNVLKAAAEQAYDINATNQDGRTPLRFAANYGHETACSFLVARGIDVPLRGVSVLETAIEGGHPRGIVMIFPRCNIEGEYHLLEAASSLGFHDAADIFIKMGNFQSRHYEDANTGNYTGIDPSHRKWVNYHVETSLTVVEEKCDLEVPTYLGELSGRRPDHLRKTQLASLYASTGLFAVLTHVIDLVRGATAHTMGSRRSVTAVPIGRSCPSLTRNI
ncbi:uncharacterized protein BO96DRAFT_433266 [Aspergillus niger CBS 101883]|uniref:uncharacterized protein n=1 Tax=Aspergillus lacticoffeatus (strain CBS 101883) TaxID=1450533 RepID=UPI000D7FB555|nr:uncharacterized protein BO96DRAFT_433266 [Aspergillus niger CBS 101883]PYH57819.1 hypothetical protein BO96DRAFT_433266 [Aspergillus niger CBS 101883]